MSMGTIALSGGRARREVQREAMLDACRWIIDMEEQTLGEDPEPPEECHGNLAAARALKGRLHAGDGALAVPSFLLPHVLGVVAERVESAACSIVEYDRQDESVDVVLALSPLLKRLRNALRESAAA